MAFKILIVENEPNLLELMTLFLRKSGYKVEHAHTGKEALALCDCAQPHLVIIGNTLPDMDELTLCEQMSKQSRRGHVIISNRASKESIIQGFKRGADDYFVKPFDLDVFLVRVESLLRRIFISSRYNETISRNVRFDSFNSKVMFHSTVISLTQTEFKILFHLYQSKKFITTQELTRQLYGNSDTTVSTRTISVHIAKLRKKLNAADISWASIESKYNKGYRFICE